MDASRRAVNSAMDTFKGMTIVFDQGERALSDVIDSRRALVDGRLNWKSQSRPTGKPALPAGRHGAAVAGLVQFKSAGCKALVEAGSLHAGGG